MRSGQTFVYVIMGRTGIGLLCLYLCCSTLTSLGQLVNVAKGKPCNQSTYLGSTHPCSFAVNGETSGDFDLPNCIHTADYDYTPWFEVDLGRKYFVYNITLWARIRYTSRLYPLTITVDGQLCVKAYTTDSRNQSLTCSSPVYGQVVRLTKDYEHTVNKYLLNLCELQIWCCNAGWYGDRCDTQCSTKTPRCTQCVQDGGQCTECSGHFQPPQCTGCEDGYYRSGSTCVQCSRGCKNNQCDPASGTCTQGCEDGYYNMSSSTCVQCSSNCSNDQCDSVSGRCTRGCTPGYHGDQCNLPCSSLDEECIQCTQDGNCTAYKTKFKFPRCTETLQEQKENLVGPVVGAVVGFIVGVGIMAIIVTAVICWRRKSYRNAGKPGAIEMSSSALANNLNDSAITGSGPPPPASSTAGDAVNVYEIEDNDNDTTNGHLWQAAPPSSTSAADVGGNVYENEVKENNYDKLCPYSNDDGDRQPYTDIAHVSNQN